MADVPAILSGLAALPPGDFAAFGEVDVQKLSKIQKLTGSFLGRNWVTIPHVTHFDDIDITALEAHRQALNAAKGTKLSPLPFLVKAVVAALTAMPKFNASLDLETSSIVLKRYFHIGIATDTPNGLMVPVVRDCDKKDIDTIAAETADLANRARTKGLPMSDMMGGCFTISSLGNLGGTGFTPIINAPELAILGVSKSRKQPVPGPDGEIVWRTVLPVSLSYDHRVINGVDAGNFIAQLTKSIAAPETAA